jgi:hypothetical protein
MARRKVIFISGPMTGYEDYNRAAFHAAANELAGQGYVVLNPAVLPDGLAHDEYMQICLAMLEQADEIYVLDGWGRSKGAQREVQRAHALGLIMKFQSGCAAQVVMDKLYSDSQSIMTYGVQGMRRYFDNLSETYRRDMQTVGARKCREAVGYCDEFLMVLGGFEVTNAQNSN